MTGTYAAIYYDIPTQVAMRGWFNDNGFRSSARNRIDKLHTTIIYSRVALPSASELAGPRTFAVQPESFDIFDFKNDDGSDSCALVLKVSCPPIVCLHEQLIALGGTHDFDLYEPHVSLAYGVKPDFDLTKLELPSFTLITSSIIVEQLNF